VFFFQAEDGIRDGHVTGVQTCALPISVFSERIHPFMQANDIRRGIVIVFNGDLCKVMEFNHHTPGNLRAMVQAKLRNMRTGNQRSEERRVGKEWRSRWTAEEQKKNTKI